MLTSQCIIDVKQVSLRQGGVPILQKVDFQIYQGEFVFLTGRTGSGKSSLLKMLYADMPLAAGKVNVAGFSLQDITAQQVPFLRRKLGIIFQDFQLLIDRNVEDNLNFVLKATGWTDNAKIKKKIAHVLMRVGLDGATKKFPYQLSGGEQQRVVIARALLNDPLILIADEPTGNLDAFVAQGIFSLFEEINRGGTAILMATHNPFFTEGSQQRIIECIDGLIHDSHAQRNG